MTTTQTQAEQKASRMFSDLLSPTREIWEPTYQELTLLIQCAKVGRNALASCKDEKATVQDLIKHVVIALRLDLPRFYRQRVSK